MKKKEEYITKQELEDLQFQIKEIEEQRQRLDILDKEIKRNERLLKILNVGIYIVAIAYAAWIYHVIFNK